MLKHADIWRAIDRLASAKGLTASGLARQAGLDPTTFNRSKRAGADGKLRWPSTESIAKVLEATATPFCDFVGLIGETRGPAAVQRLPVLDCSQAGDSGHFDEAGHPVGEGWDALLFPNLGDSRAYVLEMAGDAMAPAYRDGDRLVVSPAAGIRRGDRVVALTRAGELLIRQLARETATRIELQALNPTHPDRAFLRGEIAWMARILWAGQ